MESIGVCYGWEGTDITTEKWSLSAGRNVVKLYQKHGIGAMRIYKACRDILEALKDTNINLIMDAPISHGRFSTESKAAEWVKENIWQYKDHVSFKYIAVRNDVMWKDDRGILPAMKYIYKAIRHAGLKDKIKVSTAVRFDVFTETDRPSRARFYTESDGAHMPDIVQFLAQTGAPLLVNVYPYFSRIEKPQYITLDYALFREPNPVVYDGPYHYNNLFDAMVDSVYYALEKAGAHNVGVVVSETGWPLDGGLDATVENARFYNQNLINHVRNGTPKRPGRLETYLFGMFNKDQKPGAEVERHFGLFNPDQKPVYRINFR